MKISDMILSGIFLLSAVSNYANSPPGYYWITEKVAPVRSQPKPQASLVGNLRIGMQFQSTKKSGDWIYIDSNTNQTFHGWVLAAMVSNVEVDSAYLLKKMNESKSFADTMKWCERLVAFLPENQMFMRALQKGYVALGDTAKAAYFGRQNRGTNPIYLARNDGNNILVIGALDSTNEFQSLLWRETQDDTGGNRFAPHEKKDQAIKKKALRLKALLPSLVWYPIGSVDTPGRMLHGIDLPSIIPHAGQSEYIRTDPDGDATFGISLGSFYDLYTVEAVIFTTRPIYRVPITGMVRSSERDSLAWYQKQLAETTFDTLGVTDFKYRSLAEYGYVEALVAGQREDRITLAAQRGIFSPTRKLVWPPESTLGCTNNAMESMVLEPDPPWFRFGPNANFPAFSVQPFTSNYSLDDINSHNGNSGYSLVKISGAGFKIYTIRNDYSGD